MLQNFLKKFISIFTVTVLIMSGFGKVFAEPGDSDDLEYIDTTSGEIKWSKFCINKLQEKEKLQNEFGEIKPRENFNPKRVIKYYDGENRLIENQVIDERVEYDKILTILRNIEAQALNREVGLNDLSNISEQDKIKVVKGIFEWVVKNINYYDGSISELGEKIDDTKAADQDAIATFYSKKGVCEGITNLTIMFAKLAGIKAVDLTSIDDEDGFSHVFPAVYLDDDESKGRKGWVVFDPTWAISNFNYFRLNCININHNDFLKIFDIAENCKWDNRAKINNKKDIKWNFKILNLMRYVFKAYSFEHKNIFSGADEYFSELIDGDDDGISLKKILDVVSLRSYDKEVVKYLRGYGVDIEELRKTRVFDIKNINNKINEAINSYLKKLNCKYEQLEKDGFNKSTPKISNFSIVKNTRSKDHLTRNLYVNYSLNLMHISTKRFFSGLAQKNDNILNKNCNIEFNNEFESFFRNETEKNFPACYFKEMSFKDSNLQLFKFGSHTVDCIGPSPVKYSLGEEEYYKFFANISGPGGNSRLSVGHSLNRNIYNLVKHFDDSIKKHIDDEKKTKSMLGKKRKASDDCENLLKEKARKDFMNQLKMEDERGYLALSLFFAKSKKGVVLKSDEDFDIPFLFTKKFVELSEVFPDEFGSIKLEGKWKIDFGGSDLSILKKLDFTHCTTYEKEGECIYEKDENGAKKLIFEF